MASPGRALAVLLGLHLVIWTILPILASPNLQLDLAENLTFGKEWQLSYWKHPPLPWWIGEAAYRLTRRIEVVYLLGPISVVATLYGVWLLACDVLQHSATRQSGGQMGSGETSAAAFSRPLWQALIAVAVLEGIHYYNSSAVKFSHDTIQLPLWTFTALFLYRALTRQRLLYWVLAGVFMALCFWGKYLAIVLAASVGLFMLFDPSARRCWRTPGPYLMALAFCVVLAPNIYALVDTDFLPFRYADERARVAANWKQFVLFPLRWIGGQLLYLLPTLGLFALLYGGAPVKPRPAEGADAAFARRYVTMLALGPFLITTLVATGLGRLAVALWGYPLWSFLPLAAIVWFGPVSDPQRLRRFAYGFVAVFFAIPVIFAAFQWGESFVRDRPKATDFPGEAFAKLVTAAWHEKTGKPLVYATGTEFAVNNVAVYSPDRPHVMPHGNPKLAPWIDMRDVREHGILIVWEEGSRRANPAEWAKTFPGMPMEGILATLPYQTLRPIRPARLRYAIVPPWP